MVLVHGTCVAIDGTAVLLCGPSASGKSDLALRLIDQGARLVADDQVELEARAGTLHAAAPEVLSGLLEVRGMGIVRLPHCAGAVVAAVIELAPEAEVERLPEAASRDFDGVALPLYRLAAFAASTPAKVRLALAGLGRGKS
ncbi:MAG: HPr kinase/phosphatase C-terminal domain-containing protein [Alphaproteobacteria bacterium]|jgi:serine kinase of HPr protein (carbohydrate metabolism regulator)|nr:hypothetical protein [Rhodospirillaceae bacterium]MDP6405427.1 HPr kinase/phosphatase C-terminal domain-containing protein [Alphaproteobacteria bacterium]MDP6624332.1 HPr kinase/phosphatase C-terminal domain-containing protein [Alphaproteobacteria bacterium]|tara:strand:+ start:1399 stop:1824 length:426 start_codon:yes stop_codon:yes gene_type:complete